MVFQSVDRWWVLMASTKTLKWSYLYLLASAAIINSGYTVSGRKSSGISVYYM